MPESNIGVEKLSQLHLAILAYKFFNKSKNDNEAQKTLSIVNEKYEQILEAYNNKNLYNMWANKSSTSVWFSSYIVQVLSDARDVIKINSNIIKDAYEYIKTKQNTTGSFEDKEYINYRCISPTVDVNYLTAYVTLAYLRDNDTFIIKESLSKATSFLEESKIKHDIDGIIVSYALLLRNGRNDKEKEFFERVKHNYENSHADNKNIGVFIEVASLATLYYLQKNDSSGALKPITWLMKIREKNGGFFTTYNSAIALKAIYEYNRAIGFYTKTNATVNITGLTEVKSFNLTDQFELLNYEENENRSPIEQSRTVHFEFNGKGLIYCGFWYQYAFETKINKEETFIITSSNNDENGRKQITIEVKLKNNSHVPPPVVIEVSLPSGYDFLSSNSLEVKLL